MHYKYKVKHCPNRLNEVRQLFEEEGFKLKEICLTDTLAFECIKEINVEDLMIRLSEAYESAGSELLYIEGGIVE